MIDNSSFYNLTNPAFTQDIGSTMIGAMYPTTIDPISGLPESTLIETGGKINNGQPDKDTYAPNETKRDKEKRVIKNILIAAGLFVLGAFAVHKLKVPMGKLATAAKSAGNKCISAIKKGYNFVKTSAINIFTKIKSKISP